MQGLLRRDRHEQNLRLALLLFTFVFDFPNSSQFLNVLDKRYTTGFLVNAMTVIDIDGKPHPHVGTALLEQY